MGSSPTARTIIVMLRIKILSVTTFMFFSLNVFSQTFEEKIEKFLLENPEVILKSLQNFEENVVNSTIREAPKPFNFTT